VALEHELTADLEVLAERDSASITAPEWERAIAAHKGLIALGLALPVEGGWSERRSPTMQCSRGEGQTPSVT
jgi:hypothetical protein